MSDMKLVVTCNEDGTSSEKYIPLSAEELAQRELDAAAVTEAQALRDAELAAAEAARESAVTKLVAVGLTEEEIAALKG
jgi:DNA-binding NarL/FixJ family response regulator